MTDTAINPSDDEIRTRAHQLWEQAGRPDGRDEEFWHQAAKELSQDHEQGDAPSESSPAFTE
jgi:hypothetical protein